ncbi:hypothetical protein IWX90DRAFT_435 [Phyllosticta citrichinensis]|uniref:Uncharacterized protein n=1 Tax=Phyllosticta citrichinensis TaxID=1130410 RepID=A0ABR1Y4T7_9PEZI
MLSSSRRHRSHHQRAGQRKSSKQRKSLAERPRADRKVWPNSNQTGSKSSPELVWHPPINQSEPDCQKPEEKGQHTQPPTHRHHHSTTNPVRHSISDNTTHNTSPPLTSSDGNVTHRGDNFERALAPCTQILLVVLQSFSQHCLPRSRRNLEPTRVAERMVYCKPITSRLVSPRFFCCCRSVPSIRHRSRQVRSNLARHCCTHALHSYLPAERPTKIVNQPGGQQVNRRAAPPACSRRRRSGGLARSGSTAPLAWRQRAGGREDQEQIRADCTQIR